jgi:hypothetical protein
VARIDGWGHGSTPSMTFPSPTWSRADSSSALSSVDDMDVDPSTNNALLGSICTSSSELRQRSVCFVVSSPM